MSGPPGPAFPRLHVRPPTGWLNDPNGPIRWRGRYHLFFQYQPSGTVAQRLSWGHASSADLAHWRLEPIALTPTAGGPDGGGCWSGCVVDDGGTPTAVYTGIAEDGSPSICLAVAQDDQLRRWRPEAVPVAHPPDGMNVDHYRDPFVLTVGGSRYAVVGAGRSGARRPAVLLYACDDLRAWTYLGPLLDSEDPVTSGLLGCDVFECPQLVRVDGRWVLVVSLWADDTLGAVGYAVGDLVPDGAGLRLRATSAGFVDAGHDFYAPAALQDDGRVLLWGWSWEDLDPDEVARAGWAGVLTLPRVLTLGTDGQLVTSPAPETALLRDLARAQTVRLAAGDAPVPLPGTALDLVLDLALPSQQDAPVRVDLGVGERGLSVLVDAGRRLVSVARPGAPAAGYSRGPRTHSARLPATAEQLRLRAVVDGSLVELHVHDGPTFTERVYPTGRDPWRLELHGPPGCVADVQVWPLGGSPAGSPVESPV